MSYSMTKVFDQLCAGMTRDERGMDREMDTLEMISGWSLLTPLHRVFPYGETRSLKLDTTSHLEDEICVVPNKSSDTYCCVWCVACQCGGFG